MSVTPAALSKAESLARFAKTQGTPLNTFALVITLGEAYELLDYLAAGGMGKLMYHERLVADILEAKSKGDPWQVLEHFQLKGFDIVRADKVLN